METEAPAEEVGSAEADIGVAGNTKQKFIRGDVNYDGVVNGADVEDIGWIFNHADGFVACEDAADVNNDARLDTSDLIYLTNFVSHGGPAPSAPFAAPGFDPVTTGALYDGWYCGDNNDLCTNDNDCTTLGYRCRTLQGFGGLGECVARTFIRGDVNGDRQVDVSDYIILYYSFSNASYADKIMCDDAADVNDDGKIDMSDRIRFSTWWNGQATLPAPNQTTGAGADTTKDGLGCGDVPGAG